MLTPQIFVRLPQQLYDQLPADGRERSRVVTEALQAHLQPKSESDVIAQLLVFMVGDAVDSENENPHAVDVG